MAAIAVVALLKIMDTSLQRSRSLLLLVDFIDPLRFDGAEDIAAAALAAAGATASLKHLLRRHGVPAAIYATDKTARNQDVARSLPLPRRGERSM